MNPFGDDVWRRAVRVAENRSVAGLNGDILGQLTTTIDERQSSTGRAGGQPLLLLTAPRAGYGKTHLLGRLAAAANGQVVLVPLAFRLEDQIGIAAVAVRGAGIHGACGHEPCGVDKAARSLRGCVRGTGAALDRERHAALREPGAGHERAGG